MFQRFKVEERQAGEPVSKTWQRNKGGKNGTLNKIVSYLKTREGKKTKLEQISKSAGISYAYASHLVKELVARGTISHSGGRGKRVYSVKHSRVNNTRRNGKTPKPTTATDFAAAVGEAPAVPEDVIEDANMVVQVTDELVWRFIKETGSLNVIEYTKWLDQKNQM